jgi:hypothetical protein
VGEGQFVVAEIALPDMVLGFVPAPERKYTIKAFRVF